MKFLLILLALILIAIGVYFLHKNNIKKNKKEKVKEPENSFEKSIMKVSQLIRLELKEKEIILKSESIIDDIIKTKEQLDAKNGFSEKRAIFNRILDEYLPVLLKRYIELDKKSAESQRVNLMDRLDMLKKEVNEILTMVENDDVDEFEKQQRIINGMFKDIGELRA